MEVELMSIEKCAGVYIIRCVVNGAAYVGSAKDLWSRLNGHLSKIARGVGESDLMQDDWNDYGPECFEIMILPTTAYSRLGWEIQVSLFVKACEEDGGYNKAIGTTRGLFSRIRDTERKYKRKGKFVFFPGVCPHSRLNACYAATFHQGEALLSGKVKERMSELASPRCQKLVRKTLGRFQVVDFTELIGGKRRK